MATLPTDEDCARHVLSIFVDGHFCRTGESLMANSFQPSADFTHGDLARGLKHAGAQDWVRNGRNGSFEITEKGFVAANGSVPSDADCARLILSVFEQHAPCRPGNVLRPNNFLLAFQGVFRAPDFERGVKHALTQGWVNQKNGGLELTDDGFAAI